MVTLRELAERLGCTRSTVSYALRNHPHVAPATRERVQKLAKEMGWIPNAELTRHMALVRTTTIDRHRPNLAIIINKPPGHMVEEDTPRMHLEGARDRAAQLGYHADVFNLAEEMLSPPRLRNILRARGIKGLVYIATLGTTLPLEHLQIGRSFASAVVGVRYPEIPYHVALNDLPSTGQTSIANLARRGHRRPGAVLPRALDRMLAWGFSGGIYTGQLDLPPEQRVPTLLVGDHEIYLPERCFPEIRAWIERERPDALITTDSRFLSRFLAGATPGQLTPPVWSLDLHPGQPVRGGVDQLQHDVGEAGVDLCIGQLHRGEIGVPPVQHTLQLEGVWRDVTPAPVTLEASPRKPARKPRAAPDPVVAQPDA
jgi:DNA-binding LacI/PurR family transcriptional regulator